MAVLDKSKQLKKELSLLGVFSLATGTTLSAGFFLLPGIAYQQAGPAMILSYLLAALPLIPAMLCKMELATAMPRAGGTYYFLDRTMGPLVGTIGGIGTWMTLLLKTAFALVGMGAYLSLFLPGDNFVLIAVGFAVFFGIVNLRGTKESGVFQTVLVVGILVLLTGFILHGSFHIQPKNFQGFFDAGGNSILATTGLVYISFIGVTKIASLSEEVQNPDRNLPMGMFLAFGTAMVIYGLGTFVLVGVLPPDALSGNLTPIATAAEYFIGNWGKILITIAAVLAFSSVTNAGILSASRFPLAMSRDHLLPAPFHHLSKRGIPNYSILITVGIIVAVLLTFDPTKIAKLASSFQLLIFGMCCFAVIIMRESQIEAYDPGFRSPFYPWLQIFGMIVPVFLILEMGWLSILFIFGLIALGTGWYFYFARSRVSRGGAIYHVFERLGQSRYDGLEPELRGILKEKGLRDHDPFDHLVAHAHVIDLPKSKPFDQIIQDAAGILSQHINIPKGRIVDEIIEGTKVGATPVSHGVALPHIRVDEIREPEMLMIRCREGIKDKLGKKFWGEHVPEGPIYAVFCLVSPEGNPGQHLRILANLANHVDDEEFLDLWINAEDEQELKEILLRDEHFISLRLSPGKKGDGLIGKALKELKMPEGCLVAMIHRHGNIIFPRGSTVLEKDDRLTIIGSLKGVRQFRQDYGLR